LALVAPAWSVPAVAQEWSPAQQEVWEFEAACWNDRTTDFVERCFHSDFQGWGIGSTIPSSKADRRVTAARSRATEDQVYLFLKPVAITVHGDMATALYIATYTQKNKETGEEKTLTERWTDVLVREGGRWSWIADHGVDISTN
jgi:hypothetical protein